MSARPLLGATANLDGLRSFARHMGFQEESVVAVYEDELLRLAVDARITRYLQVIAEKHAKDVVRDAARLRGAAARRG